MKCWKLCKFGETLNIKIKKISEKFLFFDFILFPRLIQVYMKYLGALLQYLIDE